MHPTQLCIFARSMSRPSDRATHSFLRVVAVVLVVLGAAACDDLDGRNRNRHANREFQAMQFIDAAADYERALKKVDDPIIHYNLGLTYSKVYRAGSDRPVPLGVKGEMVCEAIPNVKMVESRVCLKEGDRHFAECEDPAVIAKLEAAAMGLEKGWRAANIAEDVKQLGEITKQLETKKLNDSQKKDLQTKLDELTKAIAPPTKVADPQKKEIQKHIDEIKKQLASGELNDEELKELAKVVEEQKKIFGNKWSNEADKKMFASMMEDWKAGKSITDLTPEKKKDLDKQFEDARTAWKSAPTCSSSYKCDKVQLCALESPAIADMAATHYQVWLKANPTDEDTRKLLTQAWMDTEQYDKALAYWSSQLKEKPNDPQIKGNLGGIELKAGNWRKSIEWYRQVANDAPDVSNKINALNYIGNVAWSKLNSKTLGPDDAIELADSAISALQKGSDLQPKNPRMYGLMASIYNFRALAHGESFAAALDRASAQDLQKLARVLIEQAKKAQEQGAPTTPKTPSATGGPAEKSGG
jgi:tetratricopeptide (TPR) repeat protein